MSKYKVGDNVFLEGVVYETNDKYALNVGVKFESDTIIYFADKYLHNNNKTYEDGLNDAWELARKIVFSTDMVKTAKIFIANNICGIEQKKLFEGVFSLTPQEALAKIEAYEKEKAEIKVGDVVRHNRTNETAVVVCKCNDGDYKVMFGDCDIAKIDTSLFTKTGRHIDISSILEQIRGDS